MAGSFWSHVLVVWWGLFGASGGLLGGSPRASGRPLGPLGTSWAPPVALLGSPGLSWGPPGQLLGALEAFLAILGAVLGPSWRFLGCSWGLFGPPGGIQEAFLDICLNRSARRPDFLKIVLPCTREHDF